MISVKFLKSSVIYTLVGSLPLLASIILLPIYTNLLSTSQFGELAIYISISLFFQVLVNYGLDTFIGVNYFKLKDNQTELKRFVGTVLSLLVFIGLGFVAFFTGLGDWIFNWIFQQRIHFWPFGFMSVLTAIFNSLFKTYTNLLINQERSIRFLKLNVFNFVITLLFSIIGLYLFPNTLYGPMLGRLLSGVLIFVIALYYFINEFGFTWDKRILKSVRSFCEPMIAYFLILWAAGYLDRFVIERHIDLPTVGIFDFAAKALIALDVFANGLNASISPQIFKKWNQNQDYSSVEINRYYNVFTLVMVNLIPWLCLAIVWCVPLVVKNKDFYLSFQLLGVIGLSYVFRGINQLFLNPILYFQQTKKLPVIYGLTTLLQLVLMFVLVKRFGLLGIAMAPLLSKPFQLFLLYLEARKNFNFKINIYKLVFLPLILVTIVLLFFFFGKDLNASTVYLVEGIVVSIFSLALYASEVKTLISLIRLKLLK